MSMWDAAGLFEGAQIRVDGTASNRTSCRWSARGAWPDATCRRVT
jgi:hypothetical protein